MSFSSGSRFESSSYATSNGSRNYSRYMTGGSSSTLISRYPASTTGSAGRVNNNYHTTYSTSYIPQRSPIATSSIYGTRGSTHNNVSTGYGKQLSGATPSDRRSTIDQQLRLQPPPPSYSEAMASSSTTTTPTVTAAGTTAATTTGTTKSSTIQSSSNSIYTGTGSDSFCQRGKCGRIGLSNLGNTCYMNSIVQCLSHTKPLLELVLDCDGKEVLDMPSDGQVAGPFRRLLQELWSPDPVSSYARPSELRASMGRYAARFAGYGQQDAEEFLRYLLEALHEDTNRVKSPTASKDSKPSLPPINYEELDKLSDSEKSQMLWKRYLSVENSPIADIFVGQLKSTLECSHCGHKSTTFDPFWDLALPIPRHGRSTKLDACLELFTSHEILDGDEQPICEKCKTRRRCDKSFSLYRLPRILVIHLVRFSRERYRTKLDMLVDYPIKLDVAPFVDPDCRQTAPFGTHYLLYAVSEHSGTPYGGHYTATVRHAYDSNKWFACNDSRVYSSSAEAAVSSLGYVLFYEAVDSKSNGTSSLDREL